MAYATANDLSLRLGDVYAELYRGLDGSPMTAAVESDLSAASAEIDGFAGVRYAVPVNAPQALALLGAWCLTLAEELAWARSGRATPEGVKERCRTVRERLRELADGRFSLAGTTLEESSGASGGMSLVECDRPVFGRSRMEGF